MLNKKKNNLVKVFILTAALILTTATPIATFAAHSKFAPNDSWTVDKIDSPAPGTYDLNGANIVIFKQAETAFIWLGSGMTKSIAGDLGAYDASLNSQNLISIYFTGSDTVSAVDLIGSLSSDPGTDENGKDKDNLNPFKGLKFTVDESTGKITLEGKAISHITLINANKEEPPVDPPVVTPPAVTPPAVTPPAVTPPAVTPPAVTPPAVTPPAVTPPAVTPPAVTPPAVTPPAVTPPAVTPPAVTPPAVNPPETTPPAVTPPETTTPAVTTTDTTTGGGGNNGGGSNTTTIADEAAPASPAVEPIPTPTPDEVVLEELTPAAPLPQTGGFPPILLYGLGSLIAGSGLIVKKKKN